MEASRYSTYAPSFDNEMYGEILKYDSGFTFVDFLPKLIDSSAHWTTRYEKFRLLVDRANAFLQCNPKWKIVTCETFQCERGEKEYSKMTYEDVGLYTRGLRLWLAEREDSGREQQIGYLYLVPEQTKEGTSSVEPEFETLDTVIQRFNKKQWYNPIPGRIITVESLKMDTKYRNEIDPDRTTISKFHKNYFVIVVKIFYEVMDCSPEELGLKDFIPSIISDEGGINSLPKYERFSNVLNKVSIWWSKQQDLRFCNVTSLVLNGAHVVGAETTSYPKRSYRGKNEGPEATFIIEGRDSFSWMIVVRLYIDRLCSEPFLQMLPSKPVKVKNSCHIS